MPAVARKQRARQRTTQPIDQIFLSMLNGAGLPAPEKEHRFSSRRQWRFDWAWPELMIALEIEGGVWGTGRRCGYCGQRKRLGHTTGTGITRDLEKYNSATVDGWHVLRCTPDSLLTTSTIDMIADSAVGVARVAEEIHTQIVADIVADMNTEAPAP